MEAAGRLLYHNQPAKFYPAAKRYAQYKADLKAKTYILHSAAHHRLASTLDRDFVDH